MLDVDDLMQRCMGNLDFACKVLSIMSERCEEDIRALEQAVAEHDYDRVSRVSHRLKGAFANASAVEMSRLAGELCAASQSGSNEESADKAHALRSRWNNFQALTREGERIAAN